MAHEPVRRDLKWLRPILRAHFKQYWRQVAANLEAKHTEGMPIDRQRRRQRTSSASAR